MTGGQHMQQHTMAMLIIMSFAEEFELRLE